MWASVIVDDVQNVDSRGLQMAGSFNLRLAQSRVNSAVVFESFDIGYVMVLVIIAKTARALCILELTIVEEIETRKTLFSVLPDRP